MSTKISEKLLLYRLQTKQDPEAFTELYDLYVKRIYRFVFFKVSGHEEAEDITSEVFLRAWHHISDNKEISSFSGFLYRIARNCIIDLYRSKATKKETALSEEMESNKFTDFGQAIKKTEAQIEVKEIIQAIKNLKQEYQEILTLRYIDGLNFEEISEITGKGKVATRVTLHRAVKRLRTILAEQNKIVSPEKELKEKEEENRKS